MKRWPSILLIVVLLAGISSSLLAGPVGGNVARNAADKWLSHNRKPMGRFISGKIKSSESLVDPNGLNLCHIFNLDQGGFVIISSDDRVEPVIAFSENGTFHLSEDNPLVVMLRKDMGQRLKSAGKQTMKKSKGRLSKWQQLVESESSRESSQISSISVNDVRVDSFLPTRWNQTGVYAGLCYNYYTPNNYPTGCVATAMTQIMRYHEWPQTGIGFNGFNITVDGAGRTEYTMGGNGSGGPYNWSQMPYAPSGVITTQQRQAIGRLLHDAGTTVGMSYALGGSSAFSSKADTRFVDTFKYSNSMYTTDFSSSGDSTLWKILNSNMNARLPVFLSIHRTGGGHAVIADGYGYNGGTQYHHINLGWGGFNDAWYALPTIDTSNNTYTVIDACIYNIYPTGSGEIISGRILSIAGVPLEGAQVKASYGGSVAAQTVSDVHGVYALQRLTSNRQYNFTVTMDGYTFTNRYVSVGQSGDSYPNISCANQWELDFVSTNAMPPTALDTNVVVDANGTSDIELLAPDDGLPAPSQISYTIVTLPSHGTISDPCVATEINYTPYTLTNNGNIVRYTPCPYFGGDDTIGFYADDGGIAPAGGKSNTATMTVDVDNTLHAEVGTESNKYLLGSMVNTETYYDVKTQVIYLSSEIGEGMNITDLSLYIERIPGLTLSNWTIRLQHTDWGAFTNPSAMFLADGWETVYQNDLVITSTGWLKIHFDKPFKYNGTQNLLVDFSFNNSSIKEPKGVYLYYNSMVDRVLSLMSTTGSNGDPLEWDNYYNKSYNVGSWLPSVKFEGTVVVEALAGDVDANCRVCLADLAGIAKAWGSQTGDVNYDYRCDLSTPKDERIDINDLVVVMNNWLENYLD